MSPLVSKDSADRDERSYCYIDHANKQHEIYAANPYLSWFLQNRRERAKLEADVDDEQSLARETGESDAVRTAG